MKASNLGALALLLVATGSPGSLAAQGTPHPEFTGQRVYVHGTEDVYSAALRETILRVEKRSPRTYYAVVVKSSGRGQFATRNYIDALWPRWLAAARRSNLPLDPSRSVVVLLALDNRQLSVHGGTVLQSEYGLRGQTIDREIVRPHFIPHAKAGDYLTGMTVLIGEIERWIVAKDERRKREKTQQAERRKRATRDAAALVAKCGKLLTDATLVLEERRQSGLELDAIAEQLRVLEESLHEISARVEADPYSVLNDAKTLNDRLVDHYQSLIRIGAEQNDAAARLAKVEATSGRLEESIAAVRRSGVAVGSVLGSLDRLQESLGELPDVVMRDPATALATLTTIEDQLRQAETHVAELPRIDAQARETAKRVDLAYDALRELLARTVDEGLSVGDAGSVEGAGGVEGIDKEIGEAKDQLKENCALALEQLETLEGRIAAVTDKIEGALAHHHFVTRTVPLNAAAAGFVLVLALVGLLAFRHVRKVCNNS